MDPAALPRALRRHVAADRFLLCGSLQPHRAGAYRGDCRQSFAPALERDKLLPTVRRRNAFLLTARPMNLEGKLSGRFASRLASQFGSWAPILGDLTLPKLDRAPAPGKWAARQHLAHITRIHEVYAERIGAILSKETPALPAYRAETDPEWPKWDARPAQEIFGRAPVWGPTR